MSELARLILWRHGQTDWNKAVRFQGQTDIPLNDVGISQANEAAKKLIKFNPGAIVSSPLIRAQKTAEALAELINVTVDIDKRLMEIDVGSWANKTVAEIYADPSLAYARKQGLDYRYSPSGEKRSEVGERVALALHDIAAAHPGQSVVVVTHGVALRMGVAKLVGINVKQAQSMGSLPNCSWVVVENSQGRWQITEWNGRVLSEMHQD